MLRRSATIRLVLVEFGFLLVFATLASVPGVSAQENASQGAPAAVTQVSDPIAARQAGELSADDKRKKEKEAIAREWETDREKPKPKFSREGDEVVAELIPRGKSSLVKVKFHASGAATHSVEGLDLEVAQRPGVDPKDFRYALFRVNLAGVPPGGEAKVHIRSDFFSASTGFGVFNDGGESEWTIVKVENNGVGGRVREMSFAVADGGPLDSDGIADGRITLIGGPKDSFWGYAIGTLVIRFFGVFVVLAILQIGMLVSGRIFRRVREKHDGPPPEGALLADLGEEDPKDTSEEFAEIVARETSHFDEHRAAVEFGPEEAAAVAVALHMQHEAGEEAAAIALALHMQASMRPDSAGPTPRASVPGGEAPTNQWAATGRTRIMSERSRVFDRMKS